MKNINLFNRNIEKTIYCHPFIERHLSALIALNSLKEFTPNLINTEKMSMQFNRKNQKWLNLHLDNL